MSKVVVLGSSEALNAVSIGNRGLLPIADLAGEDLLGQRLLVGVLETEKILFSGLRLEWMLIIHHKRRDLEIVAFAALVLLLGRVTLGRASPGASVLGGGRAVGLESLCSVAKGT